MQRENSSTSLRPVKIAAYLYLGAAFGYVMYSLITQTGLCGYLMDVQLSWFGVAYLKFTALIALLILGTPASLILTYIKRREASTIGATGYPSPVNARRQPISWKSLLIMSLAPALIAIPVYYGLTMMDQKDQQREIYKVDLNREAAIPSGDVKFVQLTGVVQLDYQYRLEKKSGTGSSPRTNTYVPLTGPGWTPKQPVRFFINMTFSGYFDAQTKRFSSFPERGAVAATFDGQLAQNDLPTFVVNEYQRNGLLIDSPYFVIDRMSFVDGRVPSAAQMQAYYLIPILGIGLSIAIFVGGSIGLAIRKARRAG